MYFSHVCQTELGLWAPGFARGGGGPQVKVNEIYDAFCVAQTSQPPDLLGHVLQSVVDCFTIAFLHGIQAKVVDAGAG